MYSEKFIYLTLFSPALSVDIIGPDFHFFYHVSNRRAESDEKGNDSNVIVTHQPFIDDDGNTTSSTGTGEAKEVFTSNIARK